VSLGNDRLFETTAKVSDVALAELANQDKQFTEVLHDKNYIVFKHDWRATREDLRSALALCHGNSEHAGAFCSDTGSYDCLVSICFHIFTVRLFVLRS